MWPVSNLTQSLFLIVHSGNGRTMFLIVGQNFVFLARESALALRLDNVMITRRVNVFPDGNKNLLARHVDQFAMLAADLVIKTKSIEV